MKRVTFIFLLASAAFLLGQSPEYVGTQKCKSCHKKEETGDQFGVWGESKHAHAFETLKSDAAVKIAAQKGLSVPAHEAPECLSCHTVGFGNGGYEVKSDGFWHPAEDDKEAVKAMKRMEGLRDVGCESCHGAGGDYDSKKVMTAIFNGEAKASDHGLLAIDQASCTSCHNEKSPTYKALDYEKALKAILHPFPADMQAKRKTKP